MTPMQVDLCGRRLAYQGRMVDVGHGVQVAVQDYGRRGVGRDILFIHGFSQSSLSWLKQVGGPLNTTHRLVTYDLRGHGASNKPTDPVQYRDPARWANEVHAVIDATGLHRPVLVCWSYGGRVALDYLRHYGDSGISGLVKVASASTGRTDVLGRATPSLRSLALASDLATNAAAVSALVDVCTARPLKGDERALVFGFNMLVPPAIRLAMIGRDADYDDVLASLRVPVMTVHGTEDTINLVGMSEHTASKVSHCYSHVYEGVGHMPFWEAPERFDTDLAAFVADVAAGEHGAVV